MKATPVIVATSLVSRLAIAAMASVRKIKVIPIGKSKRPIRILSGTSYSRGSGPLEAEDQHRHRHEDEAPDHAEGVGLAQGQHVAAAGDDRDDLEDDHQVDQPRASSRTRGWGLQEPVGQDAVLGDAVQARRWSRRSPC